MYRDHFDTDKYVALAYGQPNGLKLQQMVEDHWKEWCIKVNMSPWLLYWRRSDAIKQPTVTPRDQPAGQWGCGNVPLTIYTTAVWGFGIDGWLNSQDGVAKPLGRRDQTPVSELHRLQKMRYSIETRKYAWDQQLFASCGMLMPPEFGELDRWLEPMWRQICAEAANQARRTSSK